MTSLKREQGQGLVELALVAVMLIILVAGIADVGRAFFIHLALRDAAQEGAAYASVDPTNESEIEVRVRDAVGATIEPSLLTITVTEDNPPNRCAGINPSSLRSNAMRVTVAYDMPLAVPFLGSILGTNTLALSASAADTILIPSC